MQVHFVYFVSYLIIYKVTDNYTWGTIIALKI